MASTPPHCSITATTKAYQTHPYPQSHLNSHHNHHQTRHQNHRQQQPNNTHRTTGHHHNFPSQKFSFTRPPLPPQHARNPLTAAVAAATGGPLSLPIPRSELAHDFSGRRSTRFVSKMHFGRQKATVGSRHSTVAVQALQDVVEYGRDEQLLETILIHFEPKLCSSDDYTFLLRELGNRGDYLKAIKCFEFAVKRERRKTEQGKLASAMISTLGRLGKVDLANNIFETAFNVGYGNTVYAFSALISAYGKSGYGDQALRVFESMRFYGLKPNLVTYNAVIDACGKGGVEYKKVVDVFDDMSRNGVQPDRITFNSLLAVCSRAGLWEAARDVFTEMAKKGIDQDIFTYNTLLDAICKGGQMDLASQIMSEMPAKNILPNVVTYSTMIDGYAKANRLDESLNLLREMKPMGIKLDRISYNTLISIYTKLGRFDEALDACKDMESSGISKDVVTYNALLSGYGKQSQFYEVGRVLEEMKSRRISLNLLTYSTLMDIYLKGELYTEALRAFRQFKQAGLKADVVLYSALIDSLCKNEMVESAISLLNEMTKEGIRPNVITYNSIIDAFGRSAAAEYASEASYGELQIDSSAEDDSEIEVTALEEDNRMVKIVGQLENPSRTKKDCENRHAILCVLGVFHKMHELEIKPNVITFSAILNACSRCNSFEDASMLLEELRLFDNQVYGVAHGLLIGCTENVWLQAQSLFHEVNLMDSSSASAFYNALTDMLWHFGQKRGAQLVVLEGKRRLVWENVWTESCLDLHLMSSGAARAMVHAWLLNIWTIVCKGQELPKLLSGSSPNSEHNNLSIKHERLPLLQHQVEELLQYQVCMHLMFPPIFQCPNDHPQCCECKERARRNRCLTYREELGTIMRFVLQKMTRFLEFLCMFKSLGCENILLYHTKLNHENSLCKYRPYNFSFYSKDHCSIMGDIPQLFSHLKDNHKVDVFDGYTFKLNYLQLNHPQHTIVINHFGKQFCLHFEAFMNRASKKLSIATLRFMGKIQEAIQFGYTLEIKGSPRKLSSEGLSGSIHNNAKIVFPRGGDILVIPSNSGLFILEGEHNSHSLEITGHI